MNIYQCNRNFMGFDMAAVVSADSEEEAVKLLEWNIDEDTLVIEVRKIGVSDSDVASILCESSL